MFVNDIPLRHLPGFFMESSGRNSGWLKSRGYLHITPKIDVDKSGQQILGKLGDPNFIARHAFFPLIHATIKERKFKRIPFTKKRAHSHLNEHGEKKPTAKHRPLHYATHIDSLIFGYYGEKLNYLYEARLKENNLLNESIIAYRKIPNEQDPLRKGKSTIHFAQEAFTRIQESNGGCAVLMFDIKNFFSSIDHQLLKLAVCNLLGVSRLPSDYFNVFKACTQFSYILLDHLRLYRTKSGKRSGYDEAKLAKIRRETGKEAFFASIEDFRNAIESKALTVFKNQFKKGRGIPQGLPISAILANLSLLQFDNEIIQKLVVEQGCFYRRYSDDIIIICNQNQYEEIETFVLNLILKSKLSISKDKTEIFLFRQFSVSPKVTRLTAIQLEKEGGDFSSEEHCYAKCKIGHKNLSYLGFEFNGYQTQIKSANLARFYRRMILGVKQKSKRAIRIATEEGLDNPVIFARQLKKLYTLANLSQTKRYSTKKLLVKKDDGFYTVRTFAREKKHHSNYFSYAKRASVIMKQPAISETVQKRHLNIFHLAMSRHLSKR